MISLQHIASSFGYKLDTSAPTDARISCGTRRRRSTEQPIKLVPIGAILDWNEFGDESISKIVLACYDEDSRTFQLVAKIEYIECMKSQLEELCDYICPTKHFTYQVTDEQECDIWFDPVQVWEVAADIGEVILSDEYAAAIIKNGHIDMGIGFPSSVRFIKPCCNCELDEATSSDYLLTGFLGCSQ